MNFLQQILLRGWATLGQMAPYLLLGFLVAGILSVLIPRAFVQTHLGGRGFWPVVKAALFGVPLPLCSCGVIPVSASLRRHGASRGATGAFLISTPQTGVDSILATWSLLGPVMAVLRPLAALLSGMFGGMLIGDDDAPVTGAPQTNAPEPAVVGNPEHGRLYRVFRHGFVTLPADISRSLALGITIAALVSALVPDAWFGGELGRGFPAMLLMLVLGIPIYVCATSSIPIAAAMIVKGVSPGAALVFLMTGPATNAATIGTIWRILGRRSALRYLFAVVAGALTAGVLVDYLWPSLAVEAACLHDHAGIPLHHHLAAVALLAVMVNAMWRSRNRQNAATETAADYAGAQRLEFRVDGMRCSHCAEAITAALLETPGVIHAEVSQPEGRAVVHGHSLQREALIQAVTSLGYRCQQEEPFS